MTEAERKQLEITACKVRMGVIEGVYNAKSGHPGGSLSAADLFTYLYFKEMNVNPKDPQWTDRDRFVLSKGHTAPGLYAALALTGLFPGGGAEDAAPHRQPSPGPPQHEHRSRHGYVHRLSGPGHLHRRAAWRWAPSCAARDYRVYTLLGDGEIQEGQVWEALMFAAHHNLDNSGRHYRQQRPADRRPRGRGHEPLSHSTRSCEAFGFECIEHRRPRL